MGANVPILLGGLALVAFGARRWRAAVIAALFVNVFEGALRKWAFPEFGQAIYFGKDMLLLGAYAGFFGPRLLRGVRLVPRHPASGPLLLFAVVAVLQLANPLLPNLAVGLFGIKAYLIYVPLMFMVPALFPDPSRLQRLGRWFVVLSLVPLLLGVLQFRSPVDSVLNRYAWQDELAPGVVAGFAELERVRITGTFAYISGYTAYLTLVVLIGFALLAIEQRPWARRALYGVLALAAANVLMTGSRGLFLILGVAVPAIVLLSASAGGRTRWRAVLASGVAVAVAALAVTLLFPAALDAFLTRAERSTDLSDRLVAVVGSPVRALAAAGLAGWGIGTTHQASIHLVPPGSAQHTPPAAEGEWERIILEVGPFGFLLMLIARLLVSWRVWEAWRRSPGDHRPLLAAALLFSLAAVPSHLVFNHTAALFYWFLGGFALIPPERPHERACTWQIAGQPTRQEAFVEARRGSVS